jgi:hypothetical protein
MARDLDGDAQMTASDQFGLFTTTGSPAVTYLWAYDAPIADKDADNYPVLNFKPEKWSQIVEKVYNQYYENLGSYVVAADKTENDKLFRNSQVLFINSYFLTLLGYRDIEFEFGIIPYPKFDENQEKYYTMADGFHSLFAIPKTVSNLDFVGAVTELLNAESYKQVVPVYYETALKVKYARDNESVQIMDMILDGRVFDFGYFYDDWKGFAFMLQDLVQQKSKDFASYYAKREAQAIAQFDKVMTAYMELE